MDENERQLSLCLDVSGAEERLPPPPRRTAAGAAVRGAIKARSRAASQAAREAKTAARAIGGDRRQASSAADTANRAVLARPLAEFMTPAEAAMVVSARREERARRQSAAVASRNARQEAVGRGAGQEQVQVAGDQAYRQAYHATESTWHPTRCMEEDVPQ